MKFKPPDHYQQRFMSWMSPSDARQIVTILDDAAARSVALCAKEFSSGNNGVARGTIRKQYIEEHCRTAAQFEGDIVAQVRGYDGRFLEDEEGQPNFTLLTSKDDAAIVWRAGPYRELPRKAAINKFLAGLPFGQPGHMFPEYLDVDLMPKVLEAFFVIRYWMDESDSTKASVGKIDVVVPTSACKEVYCPICDLREYASRAVKEAEPTLPVELLDTVDDATLVPFEPQTPTDEDLPIEFRPDADEE